MLDARGLLAKHAGRGVLVDTNLLLLLFVGSVKRTRIETFKRTSAFTVADYDLLVRFVSHCGRLVTTPHVLTQVSDLADLSGKELDAVRVVFRTAVELADECYDVARTVVADPIFMRLGLTDAAITRVCSRGILVLTADVALHLELQRRGLDAINFNHLGMVAV
jgi:hypothetical protein